MSGNFLFRHGNSVIDLMCRIGLNSFPESMKLIGLTQRRRNGCAHESIAGEAEESTHGKNSVREKSERAPSADDSRKPDSLSEIAKPSWRYVLRQQPRPVLVTLDRDVDPASRYPQ